MRKPNIKKLQEECDKFNALHSIGSDVFVMLDGVDEPFRTKTRSAAQILSGHSAVIWLDNVCGCYLLDRVSAAQTTAHTDTPMKYPLLPGQSIGYNVLHAMESGMLDAWSIQKHLLLQGPDYILSQRQISSALQRLRKDGVVAHKNERERDRWKLVTQ